MSQTPATVNNHSLKIWESLDEVRKQFAPTLSTTEFDFFVGLGKSLNANPFTREIWAVKYGTSPASIFLGRDFYRKKGQEQADYDGHYSEAVYSNDDFSIEDGKVRHKFKLTDRGALLAAYCIVKRKGISQPFQILVKFEEYNLNQSLWKTKPETQIKKVAEAQALRGAFQGVFAGTYDESEAFMSETEPATNAIVMMSQSQESEIKTLCESELIKENEKNPILRKMDKFSFQEAEKALTWLRDETAQRQIINNSEKTE